MPALRGDPVIVEQGLASQLGKIRDWSGALLAQADADGGLSRLCNRAAAGVHLTPDELSDLDRRLGQFTVETLDDVREPVGWPCRQTSMADEVTVIRRRIQALAELATGT